MFPEHEQRQQRQERPPEHGEWESPRRREGGAEPGAGPPPAGPIPSQGASPPDRGGGGGGRIATVVLLVVLAFLGGIGAGRLLFPPPPVQEDFKLRDEIAALRERIEELGARVQGLAEGVDRLPERVARAVQEAAPARAPSPETAGRLPAVGPDDDPALGREDAPVMIIEFSDFQCPFCKRFAEETFPQLKRDYIDTGKVRFVFRDFPILRIHPNAGLAALAAECADEQGRFWEMHDLLFARQSEWAESAPEQAQSLFEAYARELGLDDPAFSECLRTQRYADEVVNDLREGAEAGVRGTPAFFINGEKIEGAHPYEKFREVIEQALAAAGN